MDASGPFAELSRLRCPHPTSLRKDRRGIECRRCVDSFVAERENAAAKLAAVAATAFWNEECAQRVELAVAAALRRTESSSQ